MIDILLATYNGEKFLANQLYSLLAQTYQNWRVLVHDDGSNDQTIAIIKQFALLDKRIILIEDGIKFGDAAQNFLHLLNKYSNSDYIVFCDQDDIWFESKLQLLYENIKNQQGGCAVYCNAYSYDGVKIIGDNVTSFKRKGLKDSLFLNGGVQGCSLMFNKALKNDIGIYPEFIWMHDHFITIFALTFGKIIYVDASLMLYRQHANNVTGNMNVTMRQRLKSFFNRRNPVIDQNHYDANVSFFSTYKERMDDAQIKLFNSYFLFPRVNLLKRIFIIFKNSFKIGNWSLALFIKTIIRKPIGNI